MPLQWRNQIWQSLEEGAGKRCSECDALDHEYVVLPLSCSRSYTWVHLCGAATVVCLSESGLCHPQRRTDCLNFFFFFFFFFKTSLSLAGNSGRLSRVDTTAGRAALCSVLPERAVFLFSPVQTVILLPVF